MSQENIAQGLWAATVKGKVDLEPFSGRRHTRVAVIGGGYTGLSAALHLAKQGADTVLLEGNDIGYGGAGRNVGLVNAGLWLMPEDVIRLVGKTHGEQLINVLKATHWNKTEASHVLGISRTSIWNYMKKYKIPLKPAKE